MAQTAWQDLGADEKRALRLVGRRNPGVDVAGPEAEAEYRVRIDRSIAMIETAKTSGVY